MTNNNLKKIVSKIVENYYTPTDKEKRSLQGKEAVEWLKGSLFIKKLNDEKFKKGVPNWYTEIIQRLETGEKDGKEVIDMIEALKTRAEYAEQENEKLKKELEWEKESGLAHLDGIKTCENWYFTHHINPLNKEIVSKSKLLLENQEIIEGKDKEIKKLRNELKTERNLLENALNTIEEKDKLIDLSNKPLPKIPSKFKIFKSKIKTKFCHLAEKVKRQKQELVAKIEVRTN